MKKIVNKSQKLYFNYCYGFYTSGCRTYWQEEGVNFLVLSVISVAAKDTDGH